MPRLEGRIALVTGGARGIGRAIAEAMAAEGAATIVVDIHEGEAAEAAAAIGGRGGKAWSFSLDVADGAACEALAARVAVEVGPLSILVNNAGIIFPGR